MSYEESGAAIGRLVDQKQKAYGDSFGKSGEIMRILYPKGIKPDQYDDALALIRIIDKLFRIATDRDAMGENPFKDIAGYGLLGASKALATSKSAIGPGQAIYQFPSKPESEDA